jgi:hypothetical protein
MKLLKHILFISSLVIFFSCKKNTTVTIKLFNPALNEYVANATIVLLEQTDKSLFSSSSCKEIASATTDANGVAVFSKENLRTSSSYHYQLGVKDSWGIAHENTCSTQTQNYLDVGKTQEIQISDYIEAQFKMQINNALNPSISGDSLVSIVAPMVYYDPMIGHTQGGGGGGYSNLTHDISYPVVPVKTWLSDKIFANRLVVTIRKRKMGVVTTSIDTVRMHPYNGAITTVQINW